VGNSTCVVSFSASYGLGSAMAASGRIQSGSQPIRFQLDSEGEVESASGFRANRGKRRGATLKPRARAQSVTDRASETTAARKVAKLWRGRVVTVPPPPCGARRLGETRRLTPSMHVLFVNRDARMERVQTATDAKLREPTLREFADVDQTAPNS